MPRALIVLAVALWLEPIATTGTHAGPAAPLIVLKAGRLFDGTSDAFRADQAIVIEGERIKSVGPVTEVSVPDGARVIELSDVWVLPGLIDCHTHIASRGDRYDEIYRFKDTPFHSAFAAVKNAETTVKAGFTTIRDLGGKPFLAADLRDSIGEGYLIGPRIIASGPGVSMTGGHGDLNHYAPQVRVAMFPEERDYRIADGPDQVRHVVRAQLKHGVDVIKIHATGGVMSRGDQPGAPQFTVEELRAAVEEAHAAGRKIAAHAHGPQGIKNALRAGVDSIEHGSLIDDEGIRMMVEKGAWLVSDIYNDDYILGKAREFKISEESIAKEKALGQIQRDNFARCVKAGVKMAFGTDAGIYPHGDNARQFAYMVKYGMPPARAIRSATSDAAELLGRSNELGRIAPGYYADIIAVASDPLQDVRALEAVGFVMKGGQVIKDELSRRGRGAKAE